MKQALPVVLAAALLAGCGANSAPKALQPSPTRTVLPLPEILPPTPTVAPTAAALRTAVQIYSDAYLTGNAHVAYAELSKRCQDRLSYGNFSTLALRAENLYGSALPVKTYKAQISGDLARVTYTYAIKAIDQADQPWTREHGHWRYDAC